MDFKSYPNYKDSGVEWLGDVPEHWESNRLKKYLIDRNEKNSPIKTDNLLSVTMYQGVIPVSEKQGNGGNKPKENLENYKISYPNDIVLNSMNVIVGSVGLNKYMGLISPAYYALYNRNKNNNIKFFSYIFRNPFFQKGLFGLGNGIMYKESKDGKLNTIRLKIPMAKLNQVVLPCPSISEQNQIVAFLDSETSRIDNLIAKQEKLIEKLEKHRKSVISHAVTKGLDPNVPMKDSGSEWLGEVPETWDVVRLRWISKSIKTGGTPSIHIPTMDFHSDYINWFTPSDFKNNFHLKSSQKRVNPRAIIEKDLKIIPENSVLLIGIGATLGKIGFITEKASANQQINYVIPDFTKLEVLFLTYYLFSQNQYIKNMSSASTLDILNQQRMGDIYVSLPKTHEQRKIVEVLDMKCKKIDTLISKQKELIEKLKNYRTSIISHAVTGKIDVRDLVA